MSIFNNETDSLKATDQLMVRVEKVSGDLNRVLKNNKGASFEIDNLKDKIKFDDLFYDVVLKGIAKRTNCDISFDGRKVIFKLK